MTNLFLNDIGYVGVSDRERLNQDKNNANKFATLAKIKPVFYQYFGQALDDCCARIDFEFGVQLGKNREKLSKDQYIKVQEYLRSVRKEIKQDYLLKVGGVFDQYGKKNADNQNEKIDFSKVSLISGDMVKENHAITQIISQCEHIFYEELTALNKYLGLSQGKQGIAGSQNPLYPERLVRTLVEVVKQLKLDTDGRIALYKAFDVHVFNQLGFIYRELMICCEIAMVAPIQDMEKRSEKLLYVVGEIREEAEPTYTSVEQSSAEFTLLQKKLELWRLTCFPSDYDVIPVIGNAFYEHFEIKNALQILQQFNEDLAPEEKKRPLKWRVLKKLEELNFSGRVNNLARYDEDILDLVSLIFGEIERDELLDEPVKKMLLQLEIPFSAATLGRYSVFTDQVNLARQLLDGVFAAGMFLNVDEFDDRLIQERISRTVAKMIRVNGYEFSGWTAEAAEFLGYLEKKKQCSREVEEKLADFARNTQALASSRKIVAKTIEGSMKGKMLTTEIVQFLRDVWSEVLLSAYTCKDGRPMQWEKSVQAMDELIVSVMPPGDDNERQRILKLLPGLIAELRHGLKQISYDKSGQARFFKELAVWHVILMDKKHLNKTLVDAVQDDETPIEDEKIEAERIADDSLERAKNLVLASWVSFASKSGRQWGKLIWYDVAIGNMVFAGKSGAKMIEIQVEELAERLRQGQAVIVRFNEKSVTDRVLSDLMGLV